MLSLHVRTSPSPLARPLSRSATASPRPCSGGAAVLFCLLAFDGALPQDDSAAVGSLVLEPAGFSAFAMQARSLTLAAATPERQQRVAAELLRYAVRNEPCLRSGGALLACAPAGDAAAAGADAVPSLESIGFVPTGTAASAAIDPDDAGAGEDDPAEDEVRGRCGSNPPTAGPSAPAAARFRLHSPP
eukprot:4243989-Prymnesium_polylepis.1